MRHATKALLLIAALAASACAGPGRFGAGTDRGVDDAAARAGLNATGTIPGSVNDPTSAAYFQQTVGDRVFFEVDQSILNVVARSTLDAQADWLMRNPDYQAVVEGHADEQGTREYNLALGARRANAVMEYLVSRGVAPNRLRFVSYGKERPAEICSEESCYAKNRRAVTILSASALSG